MPSVVGTTLSSRTSPFARKSQLPGRQTEQNQDQKNFLQTLHHLGWSLTALEDPLPLPLGTKKKPKASWQAAPTPDGQTLLLIWLDGPMGSLRETFERYEDFSLLHCQIRAAMKEANLVTRHVVLIDTEEHVQIIDMAQEDILIDAKGEEELTGRVYPLLSTTALSRGSLAGFPRKSLSQRAKELEDWTKHWTNRLGAQMGSNFETMKQFFFWLHLSRLAEILRLTSPRKVPYSDYALAKTPPSPARYITSLFKPLSDNWNLLQGSSLKSISVIVDLANKSGQLEECLKSYAHLSSSKFSAQVFGEAFADEELRLVSWRQSLISVEERRAEDPSEWLSQPIDINLDAQGFGFVLKQFDVITEDLRRLAREQAVSRERGERPGLQMDVFGSEPPEIQEEETPRLALQLALRIHTTRRSRLDLARLILLAHSAEWHAKLRRPEPIFPIPQLQLKEEKKKDVYLEPPDASMN